MIGLDGWACRTGLGDDRLHERLCGGEHVATPPPFASHGYPLPCVGWIGGGSGSRYVRRMAWHGMEVARRAARAAGVGPSDRTGLYVGYGGLRADWSELMPPLDTLDPDQPWAGGLGRFHPFWMLRNLSNNAHALLAKELGAVGDGATFGGAIAGCEALGAAVDALRSGVVDTALVVAYDSLVQPEVIVEWQVRGQLCTTADRRPAYDLEPSGRVPSEAAAALVLRRASERSASLVDATTAVGRSVQAVLGQIRATPDLVDGAAEADRSDNDRERERLAEVAPDAWLSTGTAALGDTGAVHAPLQLIALTEALRAGVLPGLHGLVQPAPGPLRLPLETTKIDARHAIGLQLAEPGLVGLVTVERR